MTQFLGTCDKTISNLECQFWDTQTPHAHQYGKYGWMDNKCRKVGTATPGCFTIDPDTTWQECYCADPDPKHYNHISLGYTFAVNTWGNSFYKTYEPMSYLDAKAQCESDGASLAIPTSDAENEFIASLIPNENIWIGVNDMVEEGTFKSVDGRDVSYTKWATTLGRNEPKNSLADEDGVTILGSLNGNPVRLNEFWAAESITAQFKFICIFNIIIDYSGKL